MEAAVVYEPTLDKVYVMGGFDSYGQMVSCEYYDIDIDSWTKFKSLNKKAIYSTASILSNRFIYMFGGANLKVGNLNTIN